MYSPFDAEAIAEALRGIDALNSRLEKSYNDSWRYFLTGEIELWSWDGYRLGVLAFQDDQWFFRFDYKDGD